MRYLPLIVLFLIGGCAWNTSMGPVFKHHQHIEENESILYLYSARKNRLMTGCTMVTIDEVDTVCIGNPGYGQVKLEPGKHSFAFRQKAAIDVGPKVLHFEYTFSPGEVYYFRYRSFFDGQKMGKLIVSRDFNATLPTGNGAITTSGNMVWEEIEQQNALNELEKLTLWR